MTGHYVAISRAAVNAAASSRPSFPRQRATFRTAGRGERGASFVTFFNDGDLLTNKFVNDLIAQNAGG
jgi:hypothetical protein